MTLIDLASAEPNTALRYLTDRWSDEVAAGLDAAELLRYRSNLLGSDLRITNFGGGNTSSKLDETDPLTGKPTSALWVKSSGGDLGSIKRNGFATLYMDKLLALEQRYRGAAYEDEIVSYYPLCTLGLNPTAASIDTPLHGLLPAPHIDHLHPDWGIALAASANGLERLQEFNSNYGHRMIWVPWKRPGFELALMLRAAIQKNPDADGIILGGHGIFTWGETQRSCYESTLRIIDDLGQFVLGFVDRAGEGLFGGANYEARRDRRDVAITIFPTIRGLVSEFRLMIGHFSDHEDVVRFVNSSAAKALAHQGTSCPDHFVRTKIRPLYVDWNPSGNPDQLPSLIRDAIRSYREEYRSYYQTYATPDSPGMRDPNPTVVLVPGVGMFSFGKNKTEARITAEFYTNAIHVMEGATAMARGDVPTVLPQASSAEASKAFSVQNNYVALPPIEAFGIEYWSLEEAKLRRQPPENELSRHIAVIVGGANGIGRAVAEAAATRGAHVAICDRDLNAAELARSAVAASAGKERVLSSPADIGDRNSIRRMLQDVVGTYGGLDILVNTAAIFAASADGKISDEQWRSTFDLNVTANFVLVDEARPIFSAQQLPGAVVLTSSANAVVPKVGSEAYDVSKAALSHLVRELAVALAPKVRVNAISPATMVKGSTMFPRDRVMASLRKYKLDFESEWPDEKLRDTLAAFYAQRNLTKAAIEPSDCAEAILFLCGSKSRRTTGHVFPVDGGLPEAFLR